MKASTIDIETTDLSGIGAGVLLCMVAQDYHTGKQSIYRLDDYRCRPGKEGPLVRAAIEHLEKYDLLIGHNIERFDLNFIKTRALRLDIPYNLRPLTYDTLRAFRRCGVLTKLNGFGKPSAGLDMAADALKIKQEKTRIYPGEWWESVWEDAPERLRMMNIIVDHCKSDVRMTDRLYKQLLPMDSRPVIKRMP